MAVAALQFDHGIEAYRLGYRVHPQHAFDAQAHVLFGSIGSLDHYQPDVCKPRLKEADRRQYLAREPVTIRHCSHGQAGEVGKAIRVDRAIQFFESFVWRVADSAGVKQPLEVTANRAFEKPYGLRTAEGIFNVVFRFMIDEPVKNGNGDRGFAKAPGHRLPRAQCLDRVKAADTFEEPLLIAGVALDSLAITHEFQQVAGDELGVFPRI